MIRVVLRNGEEEAVILEREIRNEAALCTEEHVEVYKIQNSRELEQFLLERMQVDMISVDVAVRHGIEHAEAIREKYPERPVLLVADAAMPPVLYMKPSIMAASLLLKPLMVDAVRQTLGQIFDHFLIQRNDKVFIAETRDEKYRIFYNDILYFEAREKRIYACTQNAEYGFYDTMDQLENKMADRFIRCHRSYMLNLKYLKKVRLSQNCVVLEGGIELPLSRSYKSALKELESKEKYGESVFGQ